MSIEKIVELANEGEVIAQMTLAVCYYGGKGIAQSYERAVLWYTKAAEQGLKDAQFALGYCYYKGEGVAQSYERAVFWFTKAVEQGIVVAKEELKRFKKNIFRKWVLK